MKKFGRAWQYFKPDRPRIGLAFLLLACQTAAGLLKPWPLSILIDCVLSAKPFPTWVPRWIGSSPKLVEVLWLSVILTVLHAAQAAFSAGQNYLSITVGLRGLARVRHELFSWLQKMSLKIYHNASQGDLIYRATWDTYSFQTLFQQGLFVLISALLSVIAMVIVLWRLDAPLTLALFASAPFVLGAMVFWGRIMKARGVKAHEADSSLTSVVQQTIVALPLIQSNTREDYEESRFARRKEEACQARVSQHASEVSYSFMIALLFGLATGAIVWLGAREVLAGKLTVGQLLIFVAYLAQLYDPLKQLSQVGTVTSDAGAGIERVYELLDTASEVSERPDAQAVPVRGQVEYSRVSFSYLPGQAILNEVSLLVPAGRTVALIGPSGAGKTTLAQMLPRFYDPSSGIVLLDGSDLRRWQLKSLRQQISLVLQEPILMPVSIRENIAYGNPTASEEEIRQAARAANAEQFILKLGKEYDTVVGDGAARLSVGEKQRINLARAFLKDAPLLILDEPTSALDSESETLIVTSLKDLVRGRTTFIVAHRLSTIKNVDLIFVLDHGRIVESGSPAELTGGSGYYARLMAAAR